MVRGKEPYFPTKPTDERSVRAVEPAPASSPAPCSTQYSLCNECRVFYSQVPRELKPEYLDCPAGWYPVVITCEFDGSRTKGCEMAEYFHERVVGMFGTRVPVHAVIKRAAINDKPAGRWLDVTSPESEFSEPYTPNVGCLTIPQFRGITKQRLRAEYAKSHAVLRQMSILADLPDKIDANGEYEKRLCGILREYVKKDTTPALQHPTSSHPSAHRLKWWAETHPLTNPNEPTKKPRDPDPWARSNCHVRKKKR